MKQSFLWITNMSNFYIDRGKKALLEREEIDLGAVKTQVGIVW